MNWSKNSRTLAFSLFHPEADEVIHVMVNAYWKSLKFQIPELKERHWYKVVDTSASAPDDFIDSGDARSVDRKFVDVMDRSIVIIKNHR